MDQREQAPLQRHIAEESLDQREHALCSGTPPRHYGLLRLPRNIHVKRCRQAMILQDLIFKNLDPPLFASRETSTSTKIPARTRPLQRRDGEFGEFGVSPDYGNPTRTHDEDGQAQRPYRAQRRKVALRLQQQPTRNLSKNKNRETCRLQDKETLALL
jgi:hypothetical protein